MMISGLSDHQPLPRFPSRLLPQRKDEAEVYMGNGDTLARELFLRHSATGPLSLIEIKQFCIEH